MHLKSLTLKGFKSFASATTLRFEPGITCVVGPNGSGKSNVLDALRWVMGTQGAKDLRGGKMEDVIFAGTAGRAPLGRAEVTLTIDNADGALPIEYAEVSITRRMFRDGASEYEINGDRCRLMDVQELLSDSGIGREMHVIVGQGQLSAILESKPEERRAFIEEAAGVLKHRKRKEQTLRKLANMQGNLDRLGDLTTELRRQLKPLGKQAEIARKAQSVQSELRDSRLRLLADDLVTQRDTIARDEADEKTARQRRAEVEQHLEIVSAEEAELESSLAEDAPLLQTAQETWYKLSALAERLRGTVRLAIERQRHLSADVSTSTGGRDPEELLEEAERVAEQEEELNEAVMEARELLAQTVLRREDLEQRVQAAERAHWAAVRAIADRREGMAKLTGQVEALRSKNGATSDEIDRLSVSLEEAAERAEIAVEELETAKAEGGAEESDDAGLMDRHDRAVEANNAAKARVEELVKAERAAEREIASEKARVEALSMGLRRKDGAGALLGASHELPGLLGSVAALLTVEPGYEVALAAALGPVADAVAVTGGEDALRALKYLKDTDSGRAGILLGGPESTVDTYSWPSLPEGARWAREVVTAPAQLRPAVEQALDKLALVRDLDAARHLVAVHPEVRAVTAEGDVFGARWAIGGSGKRESVIEVQAAVDEAGARLRTAERQLEQYAAELEGARAEQQARREEVSQAKDALGDAKVRKARSSERLSRLQQAARQAQAEVERFSGPAREGRAEPRAGSGPARRAGGAARRRRRAARRGRPGHRRARPGRRRAGRRPAGGDGGAARAAHRRGAGAQHRGQGRRAPPRRARRAAGPRARRAGRHGPQAGRRDRQRRRQRRRDRAGTHRALRPARRHRTRPGPGPPPEPRAGADRRPRQGPRADRRAGEADRRRAPRRGAARRAAAAAGDPGSEDRRGLRHRPRRTWSQEYGPDVPVPPSAGEMAEYEAAKERGEDVTPPPPMPYDRDTQARRAKRAEKDLSLLGKVNPLALEEFAALEERYKFLSTQLEDLKDTRKDLEAVIKQVDEKILEVFAGAYADVAREFETVFSVLFPGGEGRMVLTEPDDLLATGVDVEARPPGKKVKRLSLLSGGEKSLVAVGMLVAIFRARPSPFYVMDEVEAALDDTNMRRLIGLLEQLRDSSQLIIITHQKPTMEIADALYGVSMQGDGITKVISQRLRTAEDEPVPAG